MWLIMEQVAIAALDTRALGLAAELIKEIKGKFPDSERSTHLAVSSSRHCYVSNRHISIFNVHTCSQSYTV